MPSNIRIVPDAALDRNAKHIISYKNVLAHIMRGADSRFAELSVPQIREMIGGDPESDFLESSDKEIIVDGVKTVQDSVFVINVPDGTKMLVCLEMQAQSNSGTIRLRARMLGTCWAAYGVARRMKDRGVLEEDAGWLEIWIIRNPPKDLENSIEPYRMNNRNTGEPLIPGRCQDLMVFYLGEYGETDNDSLKALDLLFREKDSEERARLLQQLNIDIRILKEREKELYSYSESLYEAGLENGRDEGLEKGRLEEAERQIRTQMDLGHSFDEAFEHFSLPGMDREEIRSRIGRP